MRAPLLALGPAAKLATPCAARHDSHSLDRRCFGVSVTGSKTTIFDTDSEGMEVGMADMNKFAEQVIDLAERFADITDAAQGKGNRKGVGTRWLVLPVAGAGLYALGTNGSFTRKTKKVMNQAKARASELPSDLMNRVEEVSGVSGEPPEEWCPPDRAEVSSESEPSDSESEPPQD